MCRWFAYISPTEPCLLTDVLIDPANALSKQCSQHYLPGLLPHGEEHDLGDGDKDIQLLNPMLNMDGLGVAWYNQVAADFDQSVEGARPVLYKSQSTPFNDFNFRSLCDNTQTRCLFSHIRAAGGAIVNQANCHPFTFGRHVFMHNGLVSNILAIRRAINGELCDATYGNILGSTDTELSAALYMTYLTSGGTKESWEKQYSISQMFDALQKTVVQILELQSYAVKSEEAMASVLNFCTTDGDKMIAIRFYNHTTDQPASLYWSDSAGKKLNRKFPGNPDSPDIPNPNATKGDNDKHGKHTIIASEPTTYDETEWHLITRNHAFTVDEHGNREEIAIRYNDKFNMPRLNFRSGVPSAYNGGN